MKTLVMLFTAFFRIGICTFGGGYAMIPLIEAEAVEKRGWITSEDMLDIIAIAEATPGPLAVNTATFVGQKVAGLAGAAAATLGVVMPSFLIILIVSLFYTQFRDNRWVDCAFRGIRAAVTALMVNAVVKLSKHVPKIAFTVALFAAGFLLATFTGVSVILLLIAGAVLGIVWQLFVAERRTGK